MSEKVRFVIEGRTTDREEFVALAKRLTQHVEATEPGTLAYEWFLGDDDQFVVHDIYADEPAFLTHFHGLTESGEMDVFLGCTEIQSVRLLTEPKLEETKAIAEQFGGIQYHGIGGLVR